MRFGVAAVLGAALAILSPVAGAQAPEVGPDSQRPVPRYVSLAVDSAHGRHGPGLDHKIDWIYQRAGLPLLVTGESGPWRRVTDPGGDQVWIHTRNIEERRTAMVRTQTPLLNNPNHGARVVAVLAAHLIAPLTGCDGAWRRVTVGGRVGWVEADALWGAENCAGL